MRINATMSGMVSIVVFAAVMGFATLITTILA